MNPLLGTEDDGRSLVEVVKQIVLDTLVESGELDIDLESNVLEVRLLGITDFLCLEHEPG